MPPTRSLLTIVLNGGLLTKNKWIWGEVDLLWIESARCLHLNINGSMDQSKCLLDIQWINGSIPKVYKFLGDGKMDHVPPKQSRTCGFGGLIHPQWSRKIRLNR